MCDEPIIRCCTCSLPIEDGEHCENGLVCADCLSRLTRRSLNISVNVITPNSNDLYQQKWYRDIYIKNLCLYATGSEILIIIGRLLEEFWEVQQKHGSCDLTTPIWLSNKEEWTSADHIEHWLTLWRTWIRDGRGADDVERELYNTLSGVLQRAWD